MTAPETSDGAWRASLELLAFPVILVLLALALLVAYVELRLRSRSGAGEGRKAQAARDVSDASRGRAAS